jgi:DNA-binding transcriptional MocR family regulator
MKTDIATSADVKTKPRAELRIAEDLRRTAAKLGPGALFPSVRELSNRYRASPVTVHRALSQLSREGLLVARPGDGTYVARPLETLTRDSSWQLTVLGSAPDALAGAMFEPPASGALVLGSGYPDVSLQPLALLAKAARRASARERAWDRLAPEGNAELRAWFARDVGGGASADNVILVSGGQAALAATFRTLVPFGGPLLLESPTYFGALAVARSLGLRPIPVPVDAEGIRSDLLQAAFVSSGARALYLQPAFSNPTGVTLSETRRREVLELAERMGAFVIEDDYARDLALAPAPPAPLFRGGSDHVVYLRSLTKSTAPGLRVAGIVAKGPIARRLRLLRATEDWFLAGLLQDTALELVSAASWQRHVFELRQVLRARRQVAVDALARHFPEATLKRVPDGGFSLWLELPAGIDDGDFVRAAASEGVHVTPGSPWFAAEPAGTFVRISIAGANTHDLARGIELLGGPALRRARRAARTDGLR